MGARALPEIDVLAVKEGDFVEMGLRQSFPWRRREPRRLPAPGKSVTKRNLAFQVGSFPCCPEQPNRLRPTR